MTGPAPDLPEARRRRTVRVLFGGVALAAVGYIAAFTVATIAGERIGGSPAWGAAAVAAGVLGTAAGSGLLAAVSGRRGRRPALVLGHVAGIAGAVAAFVAVEVASLPLLLGAMFLIGLPNAAAQMARFVGGDLYPPGRRASAVGTVVWGATIGAVVGPNLAGLAGSVARGTGFREDSGAFAVAAVAFGVAAVGSLLLLRPDPASLAHASEPASGDPPPSRSIAELVSVPAVRTALAALAAAQAAMVMVMTMTPLHLAGHGHGIGAVGLVLSAHMLGMFALAPISGRLTDRFGSQAVMLTGFAVLAGAALLSAVAPPDGGILLVLALFALGWGWNLSFVAASALLVGDLPLADRTRLQGTVDTLVWTTSAASTLASGPLLDAVGFSGLGAIAIALVAVPALVAVGRRSRPVRQAA